MKDRSLANASLPAAQVRIALSVVSSACVSTCASMIIESPDTHGLAADDRNHFSSPLLNLNVSGVQVIGDGLREPVWQRTNLDDGV
jgi:hypothetical protein